MKTVLVGGAGGLDEQAALGRLRDPGTEVVPLSEAAAASPRVRAALAGHRLVWLDPGSGEQPIGAALADVVLPAPLVGELDRVLAALDDLPAGVAVKLLWAATGSADYPVYMGAGLVTAARYWPAGLVGRRVLVSDSSAARHWGDRLGPYLGEVLLEPGEQSKTLAQAQRTWSELVACGTTRSDLVVALGGGVVGDLAGFCAATYQRGIRCVQVPTTLVAQVDSAYGGKTGVDLPQAKNYVGAFHQPAAVIVDPLALETLPRAEVAAGYAEVVKTALIAGGTLWERVRGGAAATDPEVIARCALAKLRIVAADEHDGGVRQSLNLGHTVAHAIETATGYARFRHGEAVALGLLAELRLSGADGLRDEVAALMAAQGLPTVLDDGVDLEAVLLATTRDKKRLGGGPVPFVLCERPGQVSVGNVVSAPALRAAVRELQG